MDCPCVKEGGKSRTWHQRRKLPMCEYVQAERRLERAKHQELEPDTERKRMVKEITPRNYRSPWIPGTAILEPEYEEL